MAENPFLFCDSLLQTNYIANKYKIEAGNSVLWCLDGPQPK